MRPDDRQRTAPHGDPLLAPARELAFLVGIDFGQSAPVGALVRVAPSLLEDVTPLERYLRAARAGTVLDPPA